MAHERKPAPAPRTPSGALTPEYISWCKMRSRCNQPTAHNYKHYGGRGIRICMRWGSFQKFLSDMGPRPSKRHTLERIDVNGHYEPRNCRWATRSEQTKNMRRNHLITLGGVTRCISEWEKITGLLGPTIRWRIKRGLPPEQVLRPIQR